MDAIELMLTRELALKLKRPARLPPNSTAFLLARCVPPITAGCGPGSSWSSMRTNEARSAI